MNQTLDKKILYFQEINKQIKYSKQIKTKTKKQTQIIYYQNETTSHDDKLINIFNNICLNDLTTLEGRIKAIRTIYGYIKNTPLYLADNIILFKVTDLEKNIILYINSIYIKTIKKEGNICKINFIDDTFLFVCLPYEYVNKQYEKALRIKKNNQKII